MNRMNVDFVAKEKLCTSCGACAGVCPTHAIEMDLSRYGIYEPLIDEDLCIRCKRCVEVCPGHSFDYRFFYKQVHSDLPEHIVLGMHRKIFTGHSTDGEILKKSQSGGFVSTLISHCLDEGLIDGAVVTRWHPNSPFEPQTYIARNREQVLEAVGSKYNPVPAAQMIDTLLKIPGRYIFVGTSCQIQGMRKAETIFPILSDRIVLYVGLHCLGVFTYYFHDQILHKIRRKKEQIEYFRHRDKVWRGWTCDMRIVDKSKCEHNIDRFNSRLWPRPYFTNWRCYLCFDKANEFSDVSCGDCWISSETQFFESQGYDLKRGVSDFVIRTDRSEKYIKSMIDKRKFVVHETNADDISLSIKVSEKKIGIDSYQKFARLIGRGVPYYGVSFESGESDRILLTWIRSITSVIIAGFHYCFFILLQYRIIRAIVKNVPHRFFYWMNKLLAPWQIRVNSVDLIAKISKEMDV